MKDGDKNPLGTDADIEAEAAMWLARTGEGMEAAAQAEFGKWRAADVRHAAAVDRLSQAVALLGKLPELRRDPRLLRRAGAPGVAGPAAGRTPRHFWRPLAGVAAGLALAAAGWWLWPARSVDHQSYATGAEGYHRAGLPDGSVVELNADSSLEVRFTATERRVMLTGGEAHFNVAKNPARPFIVTAGHVQVRAVGTMFAVRRDARQVRVLVTEGKVAVGIGAQAPEAIAASSFADTPLVAGQSLRIATVGPVFVGQPETVGTQEMRVMLAWQDRQLLLADMPLAEAVERFNRRNAVQLAIGDAALADRPVGGTFQVDDVEVFIRLLEATGEITAERVSPGRIILHQAPLAQRR
jgi:transmembrane sensor